MDLNLLRALHFLLGEESVSRAAVRASVTQSAMSRSLQRLRALFDDELLVRQGHRMRPTPRAEALRPALARILANIELMMSVESDFDPRTSRHAFSIAALDFVQIALAAPLLAALHQRAPQASLEIHDALRRSDENLDGDTLDLVIRPHIDGPRPNLRTRHLYEDDFSCLLRRRHTLIRAKRWSAETYAELDHILVAPLGSSRGLVDTQLATLGLHRRIVATTSSFLAAPSLIANSNRVLTMPTRTAKVLAKQFGLALVAPPLELPSLRLSQVWHERRMNDPVHRWFRNLVVEVIGTISQPRK